jgi:NRAMP (natural resistance-associated macrophage protein)-like metal ion transporter
MSDEPKPPLWLSTLETETATTTEVPAQIAVPVNDEASTSETPVRWWQRLGAGLVTGAADDDPSGIATYSQVGARFGYAMLWTIFLTLPLMIAIQMVSARIGRVTGRGLSDNLIRNFPAPVVWPLVMLVIGANVINIGADLAAMGEALKLLIGGPALVYAVGFAILSTVLQVFIPFNRYAPVLKFLALSLFAYVATAFVVKVPWGLALKNTVLPHIDWSIGYTTAVVAVFGTTISPYLFSWQAGHEVQELRESDEREPLKHADHQAKDALRRIFMDTATGMVLSNIVAFFIILTATVALHAHGKFDIQSSSEAALALKPVAGPLAFALFSAGVIGTGMLAVPVLAGATAYTVAGACRQPYGLEHKTGDARLFYAVIVASMAIGASLNLSHIDPIKALYWSAVINGVCAVPMMCALMIIARRPKTMGNHTVGGALYAWGWLATLVMGVAAVAMFSMLGKG